MAANGSRAQNLTSQTDLKGLTSAAKGILRALSRVAAWECALDLYAERRGVPNADIG